jgi:hypothetical protein
VVAAHDYCGGRGGGGAAGVVFRGVGSPAVAPSPWALAFTPPPPWSSELGLGRTCRLPAPVLGMPDLPWPPTVRESSNAEALAVAASSAATAIALMVRERIGLSFQFAASRTRKPTKEAPARFGISRPGTSVKGPRPAGEKKQTRSGLTRQLPDGLDCSDKTPGEKRKKPRRLAEAQGLHGRLASTGVKRPTFRNSGQPIALNFCRVALAAWRCSPLHV